MSSGGDTWDVIERLERELRPRSMRGFWAGTTCEVRIATATDGAEGIGVDLKDAMLHALRTLSERASWR